MALTHESGLKGSLGVSRNPAGDQKGAQKGGGEVSRSRCSSASLQPEVVFFQGSRVWGWTKGL